ncbi:VWA domain-containing protein [Corynebacterium sp. 153RC1]|uniref:vWA domain-containing protein n=1 Tax=unclassified Corynebacterium TaxID=2624378 RepID=UPI00211C7C28|nr:MULTISPECIES: VWA domain-containing protein [unclassified Corynebacterium]MCQ9371002.1 VWA domain-containing protein [Corynebacterium sp. 35RC1]MCQ9351613.1 VWA domain-containing protein [Corynebacterium sp. 209RC1]MCQ9353982.1 VWA domain-containing protein [Corynebacterium sp. 1222RC1]MCQ9355896.1 VWA domain-containing protein [Corynebacterium sp. 122RC1]MCQ9358140.1 VWA domain-containing protein [Corynebacterium sp. 142RC1]
MGQQGIPGRRSKAYSSHGANVRAITQGHGIHLVGSVLAAAERGAAIDQGMLQLTPQDLRGALRAGRESNLIVFVVDSSGSMAAKDRLATVTGAVLSLLQDAYQRRDKVAVISVRGAAPELILPPTGSVDVAVKRLKEVATGGRTPLAEGLVMAHQVFTRQARKEPGRRGIMVLLSDGRATAGAGMAGAREAARRLAGEADLGSVVIDCEAQGRVRLGLARELAVQLGAPCVRLEELSADAVADVVRAL